MSGDNGRPPAAVLPHNDETLDRDALFFYVGWRLRIDVARMLGCALHDDGSIAVESGQATIIDRIYAAGNCAEPRALVPAAAGSGVTAAVAINTRLSFEDADRAVADSRAAASASEVRWPAPSPGGMSLESTRAPRRRTRGALTTEVGVSGAV